MLPADVPATAAMQREPPRPAAGVLLRRRPVQLADCVSQHAADCASGLADSADVSSAARAGARLHFNPLEPYHCML